jgi:8-oxo-dGTP pyrophosphatase MutT (NUDIX family)
MTASRKISSGMILVDAKNGKLKFLLIKRRYTYEYVSFLYGNYNNENEVKKLLDLMTSTEKFLIYRMDFFVMWCHVWADTKNKKNELYKRSCETFKRKWNGKKKKLTEMIEQSYKVNDSIWEIPKGKRNKDESSLFCAVRELQEETGVGPDQYFISPFVRRIKYKNDGVYYEHEFHLSFMLKKAIPSSNLSVMKRNIADRSEVADMRWITIYEIRRIIPMNPNIKKVLIAAHNYARHYLRGVNSF